MKRTFIIAFILSIALLPRIQAQFYSGKLYIATGTKVSFEGLVIIPDKELLLENKLITRTSTALPGSPAGSIKRVYSFNKPVHFTGQAGIVYSLAELNSNKEAKLQMMYADQEGNIIITKASSVDTDKHYVSNDLVNVNIGKITAGSSKDMSLQAADAVSADHAAQRTSWFAPKTEEPDGEVTIYPNPVSSRVHITAQAWKNLKRIDVYDTRGALLISPLIPGNQACTYMEVDVEQLPSGTYLIKVENSDGKVMTRKIIKY